MNAILFIVLVLIVAAGSVAATCWSGSRQGVPAARNFRQSFIVAAAIAGILGLSTVVAGRGLLTRFDTIPPYVLRFIAPHVMLTVILSRTAFARRLAMGLPAWALIAFQTFRIPVELLLHRLYREGLIPVQMTFEGRNLDIVTGLTAIPVAWLVARGQARRWMLYAWNILGLSLLINIVGTAIVSMPGPLRLFTNDPPNTLIARWPYIWLPTFLVTTALLGHMLLFRRLSEDRASASSPSSLTIKHQGS